MSLGSREGACPRSGRLCGAGTSVQLARLGVSLQRALDGVLQSLLVLGGEELGEARSCACNMFCRLGCSRQDSGGGTWICKRKEADGDGVSEMDRVGGQQRGPWRQRLGSHSTAG